MKTYQKMALFVFSLMLFLTSVSIVVVSPVMADDVLVWDEYVLGTGGAVVSPTLEYGKLYRIVADEVWWYNNTINNLAADAQYYTTDHSNSWNWGNHFRAPDGHSFLRISGQDVDWGPFSNGDTGHTYTIYYTGEGAAITFEIVELVIPPLMDGGYVNNKCQIRVRIYESVTVGGYVVDSNPVEIVKLWMIGAMIVALLVTVPMIKYYRKAHRRTG